MRQLAEPAPADGRAWIAANCTQAREDAGDIAVEYGERLIVGDAQDSRGGVTPDAGQGQGRFERARKFAVVARGDFLCRAMQVARAAVVAEAGPELQDFFLRCASERFDGGKSFQEAMVVRQDGGDARLLQHDFCDPDAIGVAARAPGEIALVRAEPSEQAAPKSFQRAGSKQGVHGGGIVP